MDICPAEKFVAQYELGFLAFAETELVISGMSADSRSFFLIMSIPCDVSLNLLMKPLESSSNFFNIFLSAEDH